jgi:hypothetical protein
LAEAGNNHSRKSSLARACGAKQRLITVEEVIEWIAFRGQPLEPLPPDKPLTGDETDKPNYREMWLRPGAYERKRAEEDKLMPALQAGKLALLWRPATDLLAAPQPLHPSALRGLRRVDDLRRAPIGTAHRRITADLPIVLFVDEAQVQEFWPPISDTTTPRHPNVNQGSSSLRRPPPPGGCRVMTCLRRHQILNRRRKVEENRH